MIGRVAETLTDILALLDLEPAGPDAFDGAQPADSRNVRVFGGQVAAQALMAAGRTAADRAPHSLHLYFLRPGDPRAPLRYTRHSPSRRWHLLSSRCFGHPGRRSRDPRSAGVVHRPVDVIDYQQHMPDVPAPETLPPMEIQLADYADELDGFWVQPRGVSMRYVDPPPLLAADLPTRRAPVTRLWFRADGDVPSRPIDRQRSARLHQRLVDSRPGALRDSPAAGGHSIASLDHAMWFHRPPDFSDWLLYDQRSPSGIGARGLSNGAIYNRAGQLVCTVVQEGYLGRG